MDYLYFQELYHHGIKGQKWGYRRFTNEDGTLTEAGKKRYGTVGPNYKISKKKLKKEIESKGQNIAKKHWDKMDKCDNRMIEIAKKYNDPSDEEHTWFDSDGGTLDDFWNFGDDLDSVSSPNMRNKITDKDRKEYKNLYNKSQKE